MTKEQIRQYFKYLAKQAGLPDDGLDEHINGVIDMGLTSFCNKRAWDFLSKQYEMTTTSSESHSLPTDFAGVRTVKERTSTEGFNLLYLPLEEFNYYIPQSTSIGEGNPRAFTVYYDSNAGRWKAKFAPKATSGITIYWDYIMKTPGNVDIVPETHVDGLLKAIGSHLYKVGTQERLAAIAEYEAEIERLERRDHIYKGAPFRVFDVTDNTYETGWPWME